MRNIFTVAGKELRAYFHSPIAYLVMALFAVLCGAALFRLTKDYIIETFEASRMMEMGGAGAPPISINGDIIRWLLYFLIFVLLFLLPLITMRLYAEERQSGTIELLLTSPLTDFQIILGKFLGALCLYIVLMILVFIDVGLLFAYGNPSAKPLIANALGLLLFGGALLSLGMWISAFTRNQIIAAVISFAVFLLLYIQWFSEFSSSAVGRVMSYLLLRSHFDNFAKGVIDLSDLVYYLSLIALGIFLTARSVEALKGRA